MRLGNKDINDECALCDEILTCKLCWQGHGIRQQRENVTELLKCQFEHARKMKDTEAKDDTH